MRHHFLNFFHSSPGIQGIVIDMKVSRPVKVQFAQIFGQHTITDEHEKKPRNRQLNKS